jgi:GntR family transcriptional regulator, carbon starvation induced regulator
MSTSSRPEVVEMLRREIVNHSIEPGARLPILELQDRFGIGLTSLHKALAELAADRLVLSEGERGVRTAPVSRGDLEDLTQARLGIEALAIRDAVSNADEEYDAKIVASFYTLSRTPAFEKSGERVFTESYLLRHRAFHEALTSTCSSSWLRRFRSILFVHAERYQQLSILYRDQDGLEEHSALVDAVLDRDAERAAALPTAHISAAVKLLLEHRFA